MTILKPEPLKYTHSCSIEMVSLKLPVLGQLAPEGNSSQEELSSSAGGCPFGVTISPSSGSCSDLLWRAAHRPDRAPCRRIQSKANSDPSLDSIFQITTEQEFGFFGWYSHDARAGLVRHDARPPKRRGSMKLIRLVGPTAAISTGRFNWALARSRDLLAKCSREQIAMRPVALRYQILVRTRQDPRTHT